MGQLPACRTQHEQLQWARQFSQSTVAVSPAAAEADEASLIP